LELHCRRRLPTHVCSSLVRVPQTLDSSHQSLAEESTKGPPRPSPGFCSFPVLGYSGTGLKTLEAMCQSGSAVRCCCECCSSLDQA
jgi:hypothetical protein